MTSSQHNRTRENRVASGLLDEFRANDEVDYWDVDAAQFAQQFTRQFTGHLASLNHGVIDPNPNPTPNSTPSKWIFYSLLFK